MIRSTSHRRLVAIVVGATALATAGLLAGCGTGQVAETADIVPAVPGANLDLKVDGGVISVRDATVDYTGPEGYPAGKSAALTIRIINGTSSPITLIGAASSVGTVRQVGGATSAAPTAEAPAPVATSAPAASASKPAASASKPAAKASGAPSPAGSAAEPASGAPLASGSAAPAELGSAEIKVPVPGAPDGLIVLSKANSGGTYLLISDLRKALNPGGSVQLKLAFKLADGSTVVLGDSNLPNQQLVVPVAVPQNALPRSPMAASPND